MGGGDYQPLQKRNALATVLTGRHRHHAPRSHVTQGTTDMRIAATLSLLALAVLTPALSANAATPTPITQQNVSLALADGLIQQTLDACHAQNRTAVVAVVDRGGNLVALRRDDNVGPHNTLAAQRKAYTALSSKTPTRLFAELCEGRGFDAGAASELERITGQPVPVETPRSRLGDAVVLLTHSHRFAGDSGIGELARRINAGDAKGTVALLQEGRADLAWNAAPSPTALIERLEQGYGGYLQAARQGDPGPAFEAFNGFRALTAQREGPFGVTGINEALETRFRRRLGVPARERWYPGRAVMVRQNDYALGLFNGDIGLCLKTEQGLRVFFEGDNGYRGFAPARLPSHDSAFAMTVHKSQGSEFTEVLLALPDQPSPLLTRALFYTGITRAKRRVEIWALPARLAEAVSTRAERAAGLAERLVLAGAVADADAVPEAPIGAAPAEGDQLSLF